MSIKYMTWAFEQTLPGNVKIVLLALADNANDDGYCWPSQEVIAQKSSMTTRNLRRILDLLQERGFIRIDERRRQDGYKASNGYQLSPDKLSDEISPDKSSTSQRTTVSYQEPSVEPPKRVNTRGSADETFARFWELYPRKVSKVKARKTWDTALRMASADHILAGLERLLPSLKAREPQYVPHPSTWLNAGGWDDAADPPPAPPKSTGKSTPPPQVNAQNAWEYR
jgi:hypothetical protein